MRLILDAQPVNIAQAFKLFFDVQPQHPDQEEGKENAVETEVNGIKFLLIKNYDSYTVKEQTQ